MPSASLSAPVGNGGVNRPNDVVLVQKLLIARGYVAVGSPSGICDAETVNAIREFQSAFMRNPDGRVDVDGNCWRLMSADFGSPGVTAAPPDDPLSLTRPIPRQAVGTINGGLTAVSNGYMLQTFGQPLTTGGYSSLCQQPTNGRLRRNIVTDSVGPFRVTGLWPAVLSLRDVMAVIAREQPAVHDELGSAGMLCCRLVRGSTTSISNHSWGTAIDLTISGVLDTYGNDKVQFGLTLIAPIFNRMGWYWGAAFRTEDAMHFEGSRALVDKWAELLT